MRGHRIQTGPSGVWVDMISILVDADGCPVKDEVLRVGRRYGVVVKFVSNRADRRSCESGLERIVVGGELDAADDWIVENVGRNDIVITGDIPLAARCLEKGARVIGPQGRVFIEDTVGEALATRDFLSHMRDMGNIIGGPPPFGSKDRSRFLQILDQTVRAVFREAGRGDGNR